MRVDSRGNRGNTPGCSPAPLRGEQPLGQPDDLRHHTLRHGDWKDAEASWRMWLLAAGLQPDRLSVTHMTKKMLPLIPVWLDGYFKKSLGWLLIAEFTKSSGSAR